MINLLENDIFNFDYQQYSAMAETLKESQASSLDS